MSVILPRSRKPVTRARYHRGDPTGVRPAPSIPGTFLVERLALPGTLDEEGRGSEAIAVLRAQPLQDFHREARAQVVEIPEGPAQEGREAQTEDGADVSIAGRA